MGILYINPQLLQQAEGNKNKLMALRPFADETLKSLREYYRIGLTYTSNALEGNSLTEFETKVVIEDGLTIEGKPLREVYETIGHANAYDYLYELVNNKTLEEKDILELHKLFYEKIDNKNAGKYRTVPVFISGSKYSVAPVDKIKQQISAFVKWYNENENILPTVEFAAITHLKFVYIHPFIDGNGRVARLLLNLALLRGQYTIALIPSILRHEYIRFLEESHKNPEVFINFIAERVINTQLDLLRLLKDGGVITDIGGANNNDGGVNTEEEIFTIIKNTQGINAPTIANMLNKSLRTTQRYLKKLSDDKRIEFRGASKNGGYYII